MKIQHCTPSPDPIRIIGNIIVKNGGSTLDLCLSSFSKICDLIILLDTGSSDNTIEIVSKYNNILSFKSEWKDFSSARNECLTRTKHLAGENDYIFWFDSDDFIPNETIDYINNIKKHLSPLYFYTFQIGNVNDSLRSEDASFFSQTRIFPYHKDLKWEGVIHETLTDSFNTLGLKEIKLDNNAVIYHLGYSDKKVFKEKCERNMPYLLDRLESSFQKDPIQKVLAMVDIAKACRKDNTRINIQKSLGWFLSAASLCDEFETKNYDNDLYNYVMFMIANTYYEINFLDDSVLWAEQCENNEKYFLLYLSSMKKNDIDKSKKYLLNFLSGELGKNRLFKLPLSILNKAELDLISILQRTTK